MPKQRKWLSYLKWTLVTIAIILLIPTIVLYSFYSKLAKGVDAQLAAGPLQHTVNLYASPITYSTGDTATIEDVTSMLRRAGYKPGTSAGPRLFVAGAPGEITVYPSDSASTQPVLFRFAKNQIKSITDPSGRVDLVSFTSDPVLLSNMSDGRGRRTVVHYSDLPPVLVHAVTSAEDKRFFEHIGLDPLRVMKAAYVDVKDEKKEQGASTITMQLARNLYLDKDKNFRRKLSEAMITLHLERKLTKQQIFEEYANQIYLGGRGTFGIFGFGEASRVYFNKDVKQLSLTEAATLAGLIQRPSYFNPFRYPNRAVDRRNIVLLLMRQNRFITPEEYQEAVNSPLGLVPGQSQFSESQYFLDVASEEAAKKLDSHSNLGYLNVYTSLDLRLQQAAEDAVRIGMENVDKQLKKGSGKPQVALIALDPHTGEVKALCGGRDYSVSQLNRVLSKRPPGSVFKPFVYATAIDSAFSNSGGEVLTAESTVDDSPTVFRFARQTYSPGNFKQSYHGNVTLRRALASSMNVAAVKVAEQVGYDRVVALAHRAGMNDNIQPTPSVALGSYDVTPLEIAKAYTIFANSGRRVEPVFLTSARDHKGNEIYEAPSESVPVLDPRVAFIMDDMLKEVMRSGTAAGVRSRGFKLIAAGKTGTSHDGWFAGFTSELLCIVWVGFDDYSELNLEGARSALPIWTEFMMRAANAKHYREVKDFPMPPGIVRASVDPATGELATDNCPSKISDFFIEGTQPADQCALHTNAPTINEAADSVSTADRVITVVGNNTYQPITVEPVSLTGHSQ